MATRASRADPGPARPAAHAPAGRLARRECRCAARDRRRRARRRHAADRAPGRAARVVPRHRPGRRDADPARRHDRCSSTPGRRTARSSSASSRPASKRLDALMLTHAEADHEGAAPEVIARSQAAADRRRRRGWPSTVQRMLPAAAASARSRRMTPAAGQTITLGASALRGAVAAARGGRPTGNPNDYALVSRLEVGAFSMLLSADAESHVTQAAAARAGRRAQGRPPRQRRSRPARAARAPQAAARGDRGRRRTRTATRPGPRSPRSSGRSRRWSGPTEDGTIRLHAVGDRMWVE